MVNSIESMILMIEHYHLVLFSFSPKEVLIGPGGKQIF